MTSQGKGMYRCNLLTLHVLTELHCTCLRLHRAQRFVIGQMPSMSWMSSTATCTWGCRLLVIRLITCSARQSLTCGECPLSKLFHLCHLIWLHVIIVCASMA